MTPHCPPLAIVPNRLKRGSPPWLTACQPWRIPLLCILCCLCLTGTSLAQGPRSPWVGHVFYGQMHMENDDSAVETDDTTIALFGVDAQKRFGQGILPYGFETGILFSLDSDVRRFSASSGSGGGSVRVAVDVHSFMVDYFFGGYVAFEPVDRLRLYAGAGPMFVWAQQEIEPEEPTPEPYGEESDSRLGVGLYARAGLDLFVTDRWGIHAGARINATTLRLESSSGDVDVQGWQYYLGMAFRF